MGKATRATRGVLWQAKPNSSISFRGNTVATTSTRSAALELVVSAVRMVGRITPYNDLLSARGKILDPVRGNIDAESDPGNCNGTESDAGKPSERRFEAPQPTARYCFAGSIQVAFVPLHRSITPCSVSSRYRWRKISRAVRRASSPMPKKLRHQ